VIVVIVVVVMVVMVVVVVVVVVVVMVNRELKNSLKAFTLARSLTDITYTTSSPVPSGPLITLLKHLPGDARDIIGLAHGIKMKYWSSSFYKLFTLRNRPFYPYFAHLFIRLGLDRRIS